MSDLSGPIMGSLRPTSVDKSPERVRRMFGGIAGRYDLLNHVLSWNMDRYWRWKTTRIVPPAPEGPILDVCCGTGDLALTYFRAGEGAVPIVGADFCHEMLVLGEAKARRRGADSRVAFVEADAQRLPFADDAFQIVCVAFGLRNVHDTDQGLSEMRRVCMPGGRVAVLEFAEPSWGPWRSIYNWYFRRVLPRVGNWLSGREGGAYQYLPDSVGEFPCGAEMVSRMTAQGLRNVRFWTMTGGVVALYVGTK